ncbi:MAG: histidine kinase dimerization/phospho-acceptor domain-containing protein [Holophagaceae bacterium]
MSGAGGRFATPRWALTGLLACVGGLILLACVEILVVPRPEALAEREARHAQVLRSAELLRSSALAHRAQLPGPLRDQFRARTQRATGELAQALGKAPWAGPDLQALDRAVSTLDQDPAAALRAADLASRLRDEDVARLAERRREARLARYGALWARLALLGVMTVVGGEALRRLLASQAAVRDLQAERDALMELLDHTRDFAGLAKADGTILFWNAALRGLHDLGSGSSGRHRLPALAIADNHTPESYQNLLQQGIPTAFTRGRWSGESTFVDASGREVPVRQVLVGLRDALQRPTHLAMVATDLREARTLERMRQALVRTVSHDLRSPLASLRGALGAYSSRHLEGRGEEEARLLRLAERSAERLSRFVDDLLDLEKLEAGEVPFHRVLTPGEALAEGLARTLRPELEEHGLGLEAGAAAGPKANLLLDPDWMQRALASLALETAAGVPQGGSLAIRHGLVLGEPGRPRAFWLEMAALRPGGAAAPSPEPEGGGNGPGLALQVARAVVRQHGGTVADLPGGGLRVELPLHHGLASPLDVEPAAHGAARILVVEGDPGPALALRVGLESRGALTRHASDLGEALRTLQGQVLDLVVVEAEGSPLRLLDLGEALRTNPRQAGAGLALSRRAAQDREAPRGSLLVLADALPLAPASRLRVHRAVEQVARPRGGAHRPGLVLLEPQEGRRAEALALLEGCGDLSVAASAERARDLLAEEDRDLLVAGPGGIAQLGAVLQAPGPAVQALLVLATPGGEDPLAALAEAMAGLAAGDLVEALLRAAGAAGGRPA